METKSQGKKTLLLLLEAQHERAGPQLTDTAMEDTLISCANSHLPSPLALSPKAVWLPVHCNCVHWVQSEA